MVYAYLRVSTKKQTVENQRLEIKRFAEERKMVVEKWVKETVSGAKRRDDRKFGKLLRQLKKDDVLIISEISRVSRKLLEIMEILQICIRNNVTVLSVKEKFELKDDLMCTFTALGYGVSAEIERTMMSQRTKEGLARVVANGGTLGRKPGGKNSAYKLTGKEDRIIQLLEIEKRTQEYTAKKLKCSVSCLNAHVKRMKSKSCEDYYLEKQ